MNPGFQFVRHRILICSATLIISVLFLRIHSPSDAPELSTLLSASTPSASEISYALSRVVHTCKAPASVSEYGRSGDGRSLPVLTLGSQHSSAPVALLTAGMHGREQQGILASVLTAAAICRSPEVLGQAALVMAPLTNPDGYERARTTLREWRKTAPSPGSAPDRAACTPPHALGIDLNRNFPPSFLQSGHPCDTTYSGEHPLSAPEAVSLARLVFSLRPRLAALLDVHTFGQVLFSGTASGLRPDRAVLLRQQRMAAAVRRAIRGTTGADYAHWPASIDPVAGTNRSVPGTFLDFAVLSGVPAVVMELGPKWTMENRATGFFEPRSMTVRRGFEVWSAVSVLLAAANENL